MRHSSRSTRAPLALALATFTLVAASAVAGAPSARAENPLLEDQPRIMRVRPLLEGRHMVAPQFGLTIGDPYVQNLMAGLYYRYHFNSWFGVGLDVWAGGGVTTSLTDDINRELSREARPFELSTSSLRLLANLTLELVPFSGKAILFSDALVRMDVHIDVGFGISLASGSDRIDDWLAPSPTFGVGLRIFPSRWLSIGFDIKDYMVERALASRRDGSVPGREYGHNWLFGLSVGFSFPTNPAIEEDQ